MIAAPRALAVLLLAAPGFAALHAQQTVAPDAGCMKARGEVTCNWPSFTAAFARAHTIAIVTGALDRSTATQLRSFIMQLGRTPVASGAQGDLTFAVAPVAPHGVDFGPGDHEIAQLKIYAHSSTSPANDVLLWAETLRGQGDRPWPAEVHTLLAQFQDRFPPRH